LLREAEGCPWVQANKRAAGAEYESKRLQSEVDDLRRLLSTAQSEASYAKEALVLAERAKEAAERLMHERTREYEDDREQWEGDRDRWMDRWEAAEGDARKREVDLEKARAAWEVERGGWEGKVAEEGRRASNEAKDRIDTLEGEKRRLVIEVRLGQS
jgi:chromosome segregation ATPase